jgi:hypothetical protein
MRATRTRTRLAGAAIAGGLAMSAFSVAAAADSPASRTGAADTAQAQTDGGWVVLAVTT